MSLLNWLSPKKNAATKRPPRDTSGLSRMDSTRPAGPRTKEVVAGGNAQAANRKTERMARRELLYAVVRECMTNAGVLSSGYKFKVLSLDSRGQQFLLMVDLAREHGSETSRLAEIEATVAQSAKLRHDIVVTAVYWRMNEHVAVGLTTGHTPRQAPHAAAAAAASAPAPLTSPTDDFNQEAVAVESSPAPLTPSAPGGRYDPIDADEVAAFKQALAAGVARPASRAGARAFDGTAVQGPQSYTLLTGFEDTELPEQRSAPSLSTTQYGELN
jgi:hypothetical protein